MKQLVYAITGGNGQIGSFLVEYLRNRGHIVYELVRSPEKAKDSTYYQFFDLAQPHKIPPLKEVDVLIHTAFFFDATAKEYESINRAGTIKLFQQAKIDNVKYSIFISTISAHPAARSLYGRIKHQLEQLLPIENQQMVVIRPGLIFHMSFSGITATIDNFVKKFPVVPLMGGGKQLIYPCYLDDLAQLIYTLSLKQLKTARPVIAAAEQPITFKQLVQYLATRRQKRAFLFPIPFRGIYFLLKTAEFFGISVGLRSDSLLGLHYGNSNIDFSETENVGVRFNQLKI